MNQIIGKDGKEIVIDEAFHPGEFLQEEIEFRGMLKKEVAKQLDILPHHLSEIFAGKRNISPRLAVKLERLLEISAEYWVGLQATYDLFQARHMEHA